MVNKKGGKKYKIGKKNPGNNITRELLFKEDGQEYASVIKMLGNGHVELFCYDGKTRLGVIRGKMRKKVWINIADIVLIGCRDFQDSKADIIHKYNSDEARQLKVYKELPETAKINQTVSDAANENNKKDDCVFEFDDI